MMWKFLVKLLSSKKVEPIKLENNAEVAVLDSDHLKNSSHYQYYYVESNLSEFEKSLLRLRSYDGYIRQEVLQDLKDCFESELFPHLLWRLNDYVEINQKLAIEHVKRWSIRPEYPGVCVQYFLEITALQKRLRVNPEIFHLLLEGIRQNKPYLTENLTQTQGRLPRTILAFTVEYQWLDEEELIQLCRQSNDQLVRKHWLDYILRTGTEQQLVSILKNSQQKDVQYTLFNALWHKNVLSVNDLIEVWHSPYLAVMDFADFALRQMHFNFDQYFQQHPFEFLSQKSLRLRAYQWVIRQGSLAEFIKMIHALDNQVISQAIMKFALKRKYINFEQFLNYYQNIQQKLTLHSFLKAKRLLDQKLSLTELENVVALFDESIPLLLHLELADGYNRWEQLYWYALQWNSIRELKEQNIYDTHVQRQLWRIDDEVYPPHWSLRQKQYLEQVLPNMILSYPKIFEGQNVRKILEQTLNIKND